MRTGKNTANTSVSDPAQAGSVAAGETRIVARLA
jgi:hypothetical protein